MFEDENQQKLSPIESATYVVKQIRHAFPVQDGIDHIVKIVSA
jgi:hypothetical protein